MIFVGIDISKVTFDYAFLLADQWHCGQLTNDIKGFTSLKKKLSNLECQIVMEASGPYYLPLATWFYEQSVEVIVANPLVIKRFSQMSMSRAKTDKQDAILIAKWAKIQTDNKPWQPPSELSQALQQSHTALELLNKQITQTKNQLKAFEASGKLTSFIKRRLNKRIRNFEKERLEIEKEMEVLINSEHKDLMANLQSIPGVGVKTATFLIAITDGFKKFEHYKQLIAYVGFSPRIYESGTSVKGKGHICKMGKSQARKLLYMCTWQAKKCNDGCKKMYDRLNEKGKPERVIKIAIANKLLKQIFAIAKSGKKYDKNFISKPCF